MAPSPAKPLPRIFVDQSLAAGTAARLSGDRARYLSRVLRVRPGDGVTLFDGSGPEFRAEVVEIRKDTLVADVLERIESDRESPFALHLLQGVSRGDRMDLVVQKTTELGVRRITPLLTEFGVVKFDEKRSAKRVLHWQSVAASACEQCGRNRLPEIDAPIALRDWIGANLHGAGTKLVLDPYGDFPPDQLEAGPAPAMVLIGPEGGLSPAERDLAADAGFVATRLGPRVLRTETAAIAALAILQSRFGDLGG